jgi:GLPGLI family protein
MIKKLSLVLLLTAVTGQFAWSQGNPNAGSGNNHLTIVYDIHITKAKHAAGIEETYNGGTRSVFISHTKARIRLVSLMRIQSMFFDHEKGALKKVTVLKESGKNKYLFRLSPAEWKLYNKKYDSVDCDSSFTETLVIAGYPCKKAVLSLDDKKKVTVFYTTSIAPVSIFADPLFRCIPGTVLQYEFSSKKGSVLFKASQVSMDYIEPKIFAIEQKAVAVRKYQPNKKRKQQEEFIEEEITD